MASPSTEPPQPPTDPTTLLPAFKPTRLLNADQAGRRISLLGTLHSQPALLVAERAAFPTSPSYIDSFPSTLSNIKNLGFNDIYSWYLANTGKGEKGDGEDANAPDLKLNLIYPCTTQHIKKYSSQPLRVVTETPEIYAAHVRPYIQSLRDQGRLAWIFNILDGITEQEDVIYREPSRPAPGDPSSGGPDEATGDEGFILLPDLNWDRRTLSSLHLLCLPTRRDIWSVRDLRASHAPFLRHMRDRLLGAATALYPGLEPDQLKLYVHYQPTYYHFHIHVVHVALEAGATQATGKALGLDNVVSQLEAMAAAAAAGARAGTGKGEEVGEAGKPDPSMADVSLTYHLGEASELWERVWLPLKEGRLPDSSR